MKKTLISLAFGLMALGVFADEIYVSPDGDDAANGQKETPYRTIRKAIEDATPGTTIYLRGGRYMPTGADVMYRGAEKVYDCVYYLDKNGRAGSPITLSGYPGEDVVIDLSQVRPDARVMGFNVNGDYWHLRDFDIVGIQVTQTGHTQSINVGLFGGSNCVIERVNMHDGMGIGVYATKGSTNLFSISMPTTTTTRCRRVAMAATATASVSISTAATISVTGCMAVVHGAIATTAST